jgi:hypothetical protein
MAKSKSNLGSQVEQAHAEMKTHPGMAEVQAFLKSKDAEYRAFLVDTVHARQELVGDRDPSELDGDEQDELGGIMFGALLYSLGSERDPDDIGRDLQWLDDALEAIRKEHRESVAEIFNEVEASA